MLSLFPRTRAAGGQIGIFATPEGVAAAEVRTAAVGGKPSLKQCLFAAGDEGAALTQVVGRLSARHARTVGVLEPAAYRLLLVEAPDVPEDELRAAVRWRIKDLIDFHIDDAVIDVFEMPAHARGGPGRTMYAVTAKADLVKRQVDLLEGAGLGLDVIDIPELSLRNVAALLEDGSRGLALLHLGEQSSILLLVRQGVLYLTRRIETGIRDLATAADLRPELVAGLALEIRRSLDYFESHYEQTAIHALYSCGLGEADRAALARDLSVNVHDVGLTDLVDTDVELSEELERLCLPAVGAALRREPLAL